MVDLKSVPLAGKGAVSDEASVRRIDGATRFSLRISPLLAAEIGNSGGFDLTGRINTAVIMQDLLSARIGPDEWLLVGPDGHGERLADAIARDLIGTLYSLVDISHRNVALVVEGAKAATVLNAGVPIDLSEGAFPLGSATRTVLGKAEIVLVRAGSERRYRVECGRSFAPYVQAVLEEAAQEFVRP